VTAVNEFVQKRSVVSKFYHANACHGTPKSNAKSTDVNSEQRAQYDADRGFARDDENISIRNGRPNLVDHVYCSLCRFHRSFTTCWRVPRGISQPP
jgi:hypothetical protein